MKISILTPTYNSEKTIIRNIDSIINQTYENFEHIFVDNLSLDRTIQLIKEYYVNAGIINKLKIISEKDDGISNAFNKGISAATGEIIAILNSDDSYYSKQVFEKVIEILKNPEILFVHGDIFFNDPVYGSNIRRPLLCPITTAMPYNHPTMFFRREVYEKYGLYDENYKYAMDYEFIIRLERKIPDFRNKGYYFPEHPIAVMQAGGASWQNELEGILESRKALKNYNFWNFNARKEYTFRVSRTLLKKYLSKLKLNFIVKIWRNRKWSK
jgi:glycosyltransferase